MNTWMIGRSLKRNCFPPTEAFYSKLNLSGISECDYDNAQRVWREFGMDNMGDYHDLYLKTDVLLLSNVFKTFRTTCLEHYTLNLAHFLPTPDWLGKPALRRPKLAWSF